MKKMKKWLAVLCAMTMLFATACSKDETTEIANSTGVTESTEAPTENGIKTFEGEIKKENLVTPTEAIEATDGKETTTEAEPTATEPAPETSETESSETKTDELADVKLLAEKAYEAAINNDYTNMVEYINYDIMWYMANGNWVSDEEIVAELEKASQGIEVGFDESGNLSTTFEELEDLKFTDVQECSAEELKEINEFMLRLGNEGDRPFNFTFTKAYKLYVTYSNMSEAEQAMIGTEYAPCLYVLEYNGKMKLDSYITLLMELYEAFAQMGAEMGSVGE